MLTLSTQFSDTGCTERGCALLPHLSVMLAAEREVAPQLAKKTAWLPHRMHSGREMTHGAGKKSPLTAELPGRALVSFSSCSAAHRARPEVASISSPVHVVVG